MNVRQYYRSRSKKKSFEPIVDSSFESFSYQRFYTGETSLRMRNDTKNTFSSIGWVNDFADVQAIKDFIALNPEDTFSAINLDPQKNTTSELRLSSGSARININGVATDKPSSDFFSGTSFYNIIGTKRLELAKNVPYFAVIMLVKAEGTVSASANQSLFYISTHTSPTRVKLSVNIAQDPSNGFSVAARRVSADSATVITASDTANQWRVVTAIFDYSGRNLILRIDGVQKSINTSFGTGGNSENTDSLTVEAGQSGAYYSIAGLTIWNDTPTSFSEIENIENIYKDLAGIT